MSVVSELEHDDFDDDDNDYITPNNKFSINNIGTPGSNNKDNNNDNNKDKDKGQVNGINELKNKLEAAQAESFDRYQSILTQEKEIQSLRLQVAQLKQESNERLKSISTTEQDKEEIMEEIDTIKNVGNQEINKSIDKLKDRVKKLKNEVTAKDKEIVILR